MIKIFILIIIISIFYFIRYYKIYNNTNYPKHIAFIMDGNGRWAKIKKKDRSFGHMHGSNNLEDIIHDCCNNGVKYISFYVFSEQNWSRPKEEIDNIFEIVYTKIKQLSEAPDYLRILIQGRTDRIPEKLRNLFIELVEKTKNRKNTIILCIDYSGRSEILNACKQLVDNKLEINEINFNKYLYIKDIPDPDLIVRTSGEHRLSDFLPWQSVYSEFYFTNVLWPDFNLYELKKAIYNYSKRCRRFGNITS